MRGTLPTLIVIALYGVSLCVPAANVKGVGPVMGYEALMHGWSWPGTVPELANIALAAGLIALFNRYTTLASACAVLALSFGLTAPYVFEIPWADLRPGYFLWVGCFAVLAILGVANLRNDVSRVQPDHRQP